MMMMTTKIPCTNKSVPGRTEAIQRVQVNGNNDDGEDIEQQVLAKISRTGLRLLNMQAKCIRILTVPEFLSACYRYYFQDVKAKSPTMSKHIAADGEYEHIDPICAHVCHLTRPCTRVGCMDEYCFINRCVC